jgi:hypothetical protein
MRFVKTCVVALVVAGTSAIGAGMAYADQQVDVTSDIAKCAATAGVTADLDASVGKTVRISDDDYAKLQANNCV